MSRPTVNVYQFDDASVVKSSVQTPKLMETSLRPDLVSTVHDNIRRNRIQARGVKYEAGYGTAAESWGTGRAVSRIPRVPGGGTHRAGQAAFGNMCRGGGMFSPLKTWRRWHRRVNQLQKQYAIASAIAASSIVALVVARGHRVCQVPELPLVISSPAESEITQTKQAVALFKRFGLTEELTRINNTSVRAGIGKTRGRRTKVRRGPLVIVESREAKIVKALNNIRGVDVGYVSELNLLNLAPGGVFGRMIIWTEGAFNKLDEIYGAKRFNPKVLMTNSDVRSIINSSEVQSAINEKKENIQVYFGKKVNAYTNPKVMEKLNPGSTAKKIFRRKRQTVGTPEYEKAKKSKTN